MFIRKTDFCSDSTQIHADLDKILTMTSWGEKNQIGLNHRVGASNLWHDASGSLMQEYSAGRRPKEHDFCVWNSLVPEYLSEQIKLLQEREQFTAGRIRFMLLPSKHGLSIHRDMETRYHLVIKTNPSAYIGQQYVVNKDDSALTSTSITYHMPKDNHWYEVDTKQLHYVYNGGTEPRIHLVVCKL